MWFNDDEYEDENGANAANSPSGPAATSQAAALSPSTSISPSGVSQLQQSPTASGNSPSSGLTNATSPASEQYLN